MDAIITGESERIGLSVIDNNDVEHLIEMDEFGEIKYHEQDGYPDDPDERTEAGNEHVNQTRRFARYWVYRKRDYDTLKPVQNPDRIAQAAVVLQLLSVDAVERLFGELYQQFHAASTDGDRPITLPDGVSHREAVYQQDIYLGMDDQTSETYEAVLEELQGVGETTAGVEDATALLESAAVDMNDFPSVEDGALVEAVSGVHIHWDDVLGQYHTQWGDQPATGRDPDARIEIFAFEPASIQELREQLVRNLLCQLRDCYLTMGIAPPGAVRFLGHGRHDASTWYNHYDFYEEYFDPDAEIETWYEDHTPDDAYERASETEAPDQAH